MRDRLTSTLVPGKLYTCFMGYPEAVQQPNARFCYFMTDGVYTNEDVWGLVSFRTDKNEKINKASLVCMILGPY